MGLKGVTPAQVVTIKLREGEHLAEDFVRIAGAPLLPAVDFGVAGFGQSIALIEWLDTAYPTPRLIPKDSTQAQHMGARRIYRAGTAVGSLRRSRSVLCWGCPNAGRHLPYPTSS